MSLILTCDECGKRMGSLEPSVVKNDKYLCRLCATPKETPDNIDPMGYLGVLYGDSLIKATYHKNPEYTTFTNCNFKFAGITSYDIFTRKHCILFDPQAAKEHTVDVFRYNDYYILANSVYWSIYFGFATYPLSLYYYFEKDLVERALSQLPTVTPLVP